MKRRCAHPDILHRRQAVAGVAISKEMIAAAQGSYSPTEEYGLTDGDMAAAIRAALLAFVNSQRPKRSHILELGERKLQLVD